MCRFPPVADFPEFNKLLLSGANTNIFSWSGRCSDQMIPVRSHIKVQDGKRWEEGVSALEDNCIQKLSFWERHRTWCASNGLTWQINSLCSTKGWMQRWSEDLQAPWEQSDNSNDLQKTQPFFWQVLAGRNSSTKDGLEDSRGENTKANWKTIYPNRKKIRWL